MANINEITSIRKDYGRLDSEYRALKEEHI